MMNSKGRKDADDDLVVGSAFVVLWFLLVLVIAACGTLLPFEPRTLCVPVTTFYITFDTTAAVTLATDSIVHDNCDDDDVT